VVKVQYAKTLRSLETFPSTTGHVESCWNLGGPPSKANYYLVTYSGQVPRGKGEKNPDKGSEIEHETAYLQAVQGLCRKDRPEYVPFA
jgi:hypothetical protein